MHQLRQLVDRPSPQDSTHGCDPGIAAIPIEDAVVGVTDDLDALVVRVDDHGAELPELKGFPVLTHPGLAVGDRPPARDLDDEPDHQEHGRRQHEQQRADDEVDRALGHRHRTGDLRLVEVEQGHSDSGSQRQPRAREVGE